MEDGINVLKKHNIRITPQRLGVYRLLCNKNRHLTAENIYRKMKVDFPAVSLATVYSILELYAEKNLIKQISIDSNKFYFDGRTELHHHFRCRKCGRIYDIDITPCATLQARQVDGHDIEDLHGYFYGLCFNCKQESGSDE